MIKPKGLGRGLDALLGDTDGTSKERSASLSVHAIKPGRYQPRSRMDERALAELAASIRAQGLMQPVLVRPAGAGAYELIAGERRWRAAQLAGLSEVPALVREVPDESALVMALIENIQREDLNPIEEATGLQRLVEEFGMTHEQAADAVGRSRSATSNLLRLLKLADPVREMLLNQELDMGHARALLALQGARQIEAAQRVVARGLSAREAEALAKRWLRGGSGSKARARDRDTARLEEELSDRFGTTVQIVRGAKGRGKLVLHYSNLQHLDQLIERLR